MNPTTIAKRLFILVALLGLLVAPPPQPTLAETVNVLDQHNSAAGYNVGLYPYQVSQSFTAGLNTPALSGVSWPLPLTQVRVYLYSTGTATLKIQSANASDNPTGPVLASATVSHSGSAGWETVTFPSDGAGSVPLTGGNKYAIVLQYVSGTLSWQGSSSDSYSGGQWKTIYSNGSTWTEGGDSQFETYVGVTTPTVTSPTATDLSSTAATLGGTVTSDGGAAVTERGVVYAPTATNPDPQIGGTGVTKVAAAAGGTGAFSVGVSGLTVSTAYSYKAYAINQAGTSYSSVATFTTTATARTLTTTTLATSANPSATGQAVTFTATVAVSDGGEGTPTGTVTFLDGQTTLGSGTLSGTSPYQATFETSALSVGSHSIRASYSGDGSFATSLSDILTQQVSPVADLSVSVADSPDPVAKGGTLTYTIVVANAGPDAATSVSLNNPLPSFTTFQALTKPDGWSCSTPAVGSGGAVSCTAPSLASGGSASFALTAKVAIQVSSAWTTDTATVSGSTTDPGLDNNTATATTAFAGGADTLDQQATGLSNTTYGGDMTQTFTAGLSGPLTGVELHLRWPYNVSNQLSILSCPDPAGHPRCSDGTVLATAALPEAMPIPAWVYIPFATPATVDAGTQYAIHIPTVSSSPADLSVFWTGSTTPYEGGVGYMVSAAIGDFAFKTYVGVTPVAPTVTSPTATDLSSTAATLGGTVTSDGGAAVTERGVVYAPTATNPDPQIGGTGVTKVAAAAGGTGAFSVGVSGLTVSTAYSYKAYAINQAGTSYSSVATFTTTAMADTTTSVTPSANPSAYGQAVTFTATVAVSDGGEGTPTGTVTFLDGQTTLGSGTLSGTSPYQATFETSALSVGSHSIRASYSGDGSFATSLSAALELTVQKAAQAITFDSLGSKVYGDASFTVSASGGASGNPVTFTASPESVCTSSGTNGETITIVGAGTCTVTAHQAGNDNYEAAVDVAQSFTVGKASQTITITTSAPTTAVYNSSFTVAATASSGLPVVYSVGAGSVCTNLGATFTMGSVPGTCVVQYDQAGNDNYSAAPQLTNSVTTQKVAQTISVTAPTQTTAVYNTTFSVGATASSNLAVAYSVVGVCSLSGTTVTMTSGTGSCMVKYDQEGNDNYEAAPQVTREVSAQKATATLTLSNLSQYYDGQAKPVTVTTNPAGLTVVSVTYAGLATAPSAVDSYTVVASLDNPNYQATDATGTLEIKAHPATITGVTGPSDPLAKGSAAEMTANFTDLSPLAHTCDFAWGDGTTAPGTVSESGGNGSCAATHTYAAAGVYSVTVTVTDVSGSATGKFDYVVVYDPNGGFATGAGWINSPAGAHAADPGMTGKASFGFVSKYLKGATVPTGETEFQFQAGNLNFHSASYEWLVIAGARAQYKGTGTINGTGSYGFLLTAIDGQVTGGGGVDKFRIKIWEKDSGKIVYDNQMGADDSADPSTAIGGGSIVIHSK